MKEIEILVELYTDINKCKELLSSYELIGEKYTVDTYYYDPLRDNLKPNEKMQLNECMRVRSKGNKYFLTYKVDHFDKDIWLYSDEYETEINDVEMLNNIIERLGLKKLLVINNRKTIYKSELYEIALEEVDNLGNFMEVEYCTNEEVDVNEIKKEINKFIACLNLDVSKELNMGKPEMMLHKGLGIINENNNI